MEKDYKIELTLMGATLLEAGEIEQKLLDLGITSEKAGGPALMLTRFSEYRPHKKD